MIDFFLIIYIVTLLHQQIIESSL